jgi:hypothetical protein
MFHEILNLQQIDENELNSMRQKYGLDLIELPGETICQEDENFLCEAIICSGVPLETNDEEEVQEEPTKEEQIPSKKRRRKNLDSEAEEKSPKKGRTKAMCNICGNLYAELSSHMKIHTGEKKYSCHLCPKTFTQSGHLTRHINSHLDIRKYQCEIWLVTLEIPLQKLFNNPF